MPSNAGKIVASFAAAPRAISVTVLSVALLSAAVFTGMSTAAAAARRAKKPAVVRKFAIGGEGGWDYLSFDAAGKRLFVSRDSHVVVLDAQTGRVIGDIPGTDGVHGIALIPKMNRGFISDGRANAVTAFNLATLEVLGQIPLPAEKPDAIIYDPASAHVLAFNGRSDNATAINPATLAVVATIALPGRPEYAAADGRGHVYVNLEDKGQIAAIDSVAGKVYGVWPLGDCVSPTGLALDARRRRVFSTCQNHKLVVLDTDSGRLVATLPIGGGPDAAAFDPRSRRVYSSNGAGTLTVIQERTADRFVVLADVPTEKGARTMALDSAGGRIYLATASFAEPPEPTAAQPHPRPAIVPGTFRILVVH